MRMHTRHSLTKDLEALGLDRKGTTLAHFSYKSLGPIDGGPQTVVDTLISYMAEGLMVFPTHTWANVTEEDPYYSVAETESCIGLIPETARKTAKGVRSAHPSHSVVAFGTDAASFVSGEHLYTTPCPREGVYGKLYDRDATILLVGVGLNRDTYIHGIEEWIDVPNRINMVKKMLFTRLSDGKLLPTPMAGHLGHVGENFPRVEEHMRSVGILKEGRLGDARVLYHSAKAFADELTRMLDKDPTLFSER